MRSGNGGDDVAAARNARNARESLRWNPRARVEASGCQDHLERQVAQLASRNEGDAARHLADHSRQLISELARKSGDRN